jgi:hypothetical protein
MSCPALLNAYAAARPEIDLIYRRHDVSEICRTRDTSAYDDELQTNPRALLGRLQIHSHEGIENGDWKGERGLVGQQKVIN